ncbi:MAG: hypothetical protein M0Z85_09450 [Gammaproteobacteria bacterium]|nr:hypothetical protein [Gammaproteobacteria bacterium]
MSTRTHQICHQGDASISDVDGVRVLYDSDGEFLAQFPTSWSDDHIFLALAFANHAFARGYAAGSAAKRAEIVRALGL